MTKLLNRPKNTYSDDITDCVKIIMKLPNVDKYKYSAHIPVNNAGNFANFVNIKFKPVTDSVMVDDNPGNTIFCSRLISEINKFNYLISVGYRKTLIEMVYNYTDSVDLIGVKSTKTINYLRRISVKDEIAKEVVISQEIKLFDELNEINGVWLGSGINKLTTSIILGEHYGKHQIYDVLYNIDWADQTVQVITLTKDGVKALCKSV